MEPFDRREEAHDVSVVAQRAVVFALGMIVRLFRHADAKMDGAEAHQLVFSRANEGKHPVHRGEVKTITSNGVPRDAKTIQALESAYHTDW